MKRHQAGWMTIGAALCAAATLHAQSVSVAVVDMEELVRSHPNTAADKKLLEQTIKEYKSEGADLQQKLESLQEDFERSRKEAADPALSEKVRKASEEQAAKSRDAYMQAERKANEILQNRRQQLQEQQVRMLKRTSAEIRDAIEKYAAEQKILLVMPTAQVVFADKRLDITDTMMKRMNLQPAPREDKPLEAPSAIDPSAKAAPASPAAQAKPAAPAATGANGSKP